MRNFSTFPNDCLLHIISFLPLNDFQNTRLVSKSFYKFCMENDFVNWKQFTSLMITNQPERFIRKDYYVNVISFNRLRKEKKPKQEISNFQHRELYKIIPFYQNFKDVDFLLPVDSLGGEDPSLRPFIAVPFINEKKKSLIREDIIKNFIKNTEYKYKIKVHKDGFNVFNRKMKDRSYRNETKRTNFLYQILLSSSNKQIENNLKNFSKFEEDFKKYNFEEIYFEEIEITFKKVLMFGDYFIWGQTKSNIIIGFFWSVTFVQTTNDEYEMGDEDLLEYHSDLSE